MSKLGPYNGDDLIWWPVTPAVGKIEYQSELASKPLEKPPSVSEFFKPKSSSKKKKREEEDEEKGGMAVKEEEEEKKIEKESTVGSPGVKMNMVVNTDEQPSGVKRIKIEEGGGTRLSVEKKKVTGSRGGGGVEFRKKKESPGQKSIVLFFQKQ